MSKIYDLIVVGSGTAATTAATKCVKAGLRVAMIEKRPVGGTCALRGCDPKKLLRRGAEIVEAAELLRGQGISGPGPRIDWSALVARKNRYTDPIPDNKSAKLRQAGVDLFAGAAKFVGAHTMAVDGQELEGKSFLIAAGAVARPLDIPGAEHVLDNEQFMALEELPPRILFVGGGYISFEFAHIAARAGSEVTIAEHGARPLQGFDPDLVEQLVQRGHEAGITLKRHTELKGIERLNGHFAATLLEGGNHIRVETDLIVHGAGRVADLKDLGLEEIGVSYSAKGVTVDRHLRSEGQGHIFAAGDSAATPGAPLTPVAGIEGRIAAQNILGGAAEADYTGVPSVVFTLPELARVGLLEKEAEEQGLKFDVVGRDTSGWYSNFRVGESVGATRVLIERSTGRLLGAHMLGHGYAETINLFSLAIRTGLTRDQLAGVPMAYPSLASDLSSMI